MIFWFLCNKKKPCYGSISCNDEMCKYTLEGDYVKNPESLEIAKAFENRFKMEVVNGKICFKEKEEYNE